MPDVTNRTLLVTLLLVLWVGLLATGCGNGGRRLAAMTKTVKSGDIVVTAAIKPARGRHGPCVRGYVTIENTGKSEVIIFRDPTLPKVICTPDGEAVVFYGLTNVTLPLYRYAQWEAFEDLQCYVLEPEDSFRYIFTVWNPLDETDPYGNPWYDDPRSKHHPPKKVTDPVTGFEDRDPSARIWRTLRLRIGYVDVGKGTLVTPKELDKYHLKIDELEVQVGDTVYGAVWLQEEVVVTFDFGKRQP